MKIILSVLLLFLYTYSKGNNYYFSSTAGDDNRTSVEAQNPNTPWKSLNKANSIFNTAKPGDSILFKRGEIFYGNITISNSGTSLNPIVIGAYGTGAKPIISGLSLITTWANLGNGLYETTLNNPPSTSLNMIVFNGKVQPMGRFPKAGLGEASYLSFKSHTATKNGSLITSYTLTSDSISAIPNFTGGELVQKPYQWLLDRATITSQTPTTVTATPLIAINHPASTYEPVNTHGFFFQNHVNTLTTLGEWCYNQSAKKITMYFGSNNPINYQVQAATIDTLVTLTLSNYINFNNIEFNGSNASILSLNSSTYINTDSCNYYFSGTNTIDVPLQNASMTQHISVTNCYLKNSLNNAVNSSSSTNWTIANNHIENIGTIPGMGLSGDGQYIGICNPSDNTLIEYNEIEKIGYSAVYFSGNNTIIRKNHIHHLCLIKSDGAGIYTYGVTGTNRLIDKNIIHDAIGDRFGIGAKDNIYSGQVHGIYNDHNATGITITNNTCFNNAHSGIKLESIGEITMTGNTCFNNKTTQIRAYDKFRSYTNVNIRNNILFAKQMGSLILSIDVSSTSMSGLSMDENYYCRPIWEPDNINGVGGYSTRPFSWDTYHDGGVVEAKSLFYSFLNWKTYSNKDLNSQKTSTKITTIDDIRFEYNATKESKTIVLDGVYTDVKNNFYTFVTLEPYSSIILLKSQSTGKINQTINFTVPAAKTYGDAPFALNATATSGLPVSFRVVSGPATIAASTVTLTGTGTVMIEASQAGNANYSAAAPVTQSFAVAKAAQTIYFAAPAAKTYGDAPFALSATATSGLPVSFRVVSGPATLSGSIVTLTGVGTVAIEASQPGDANYNAAPLVTQNFSVGAGVIVTKATQTINFAAPATKTYGDAPFAFSATATSGLPVSFRVVSGPATLSGNTVTLTGAGPVTIEASQPGDATYNAAPLVNQTFTVAKAAQTINFAAPATKTYGDAPFALSATATSGLPVSFRVVSGPATLSGSTVTLTGAGTVTIEASQLGNANYNAAPLVNQTFTVATAAQTINFVAPAAKTYGDTPFALSATATSGLPVSFRVVSGSATLSGSTVTLTGPGTVTIEASQPGNANYSAAATVTQSFVVNSSVASTCSATGSILREQWNRVFGTLVSDIPLGTPPNSTSQITVLETQNTGSIMGARIRGYICPPSSGNYTFYIAGDDQVELWLSTNNDPSNKVRIAYHTFYTGFRQWNKYITQKSALINLKAGQSYYIEVLHKNGFGSDNVSVKWDLPDGSTEVPIPGSRLSPYITNVNSSNYVARMNTNASLTAEAAPIINGNSTEISAYPNPFAKTATIRVESLEASDVTLAVYDAQGRLAKELFRGRLENESRSFSLSSANLSNGVYIIRLISKSKVVTKKIIVAK